MTADLGELERLARKRKPQFAPVMDRIMAKVEYDPNSGCWLWWGRVNHCGYGRISADRATKGTHRLSYEHFVGPIPEGFHVCHKCDTRACLNPDHLWLGTNKDNTADRHAKARTARGETITNAKLCEDSVRVIRSSPERTSVLARRYGVSFNTVNEVRNGKTWTHIEGLRP